jgi:hypothetical protein
MGMSFVGTGALNEMPPAPKEPGALSPTAVPLADAGALTQAQRPQDGLFSFMDKPGATDSLVAFGSAMLRAPNFNEGLANAAEAVNKVAAQYRPISEVEINNLRQRAEIEAMLRAESQPPDQNVVQLQKGDIWYSPDGRAYREVFDPSVGSSYQDVNTGEMVRMLPQGSQQRVDSAMGERSTANAKLETEARDNALKAFTDIQTYDSMLEMLPASGAGPDVISGAKRQFVSLTGIDLDSVNLKDMQTVNKLSRDLELSLAQTQRGLGQFTEMERKIVREALPSLDTNPAAFRSMIEMLRNRAAKAQALYEEWMSMPPDVKTAQYNGSFENFAYFWRKNNAAAKSSPQEGEKESGERPSLDSIFN